MPAYSPELEQLIERAISFAGTATADEILQDALQAWIERQETIASIQRGLDDVAAGRTVPFEQFDREFRIRHGLKSDS